MNLKKGTTLTWGQGELEAIKTVVVGMEIKLRRMEERIERIEGAIENLDSYIRGIVEEGTAKWS